MVLLLLRRQGLSLEEAWHRGFARERFDYRVTLARIEYEFGFDIRRTDRDTSTYRIVGRHRWNGAYRSFVIIDPGWPNVRH